MRPSVIIGSSFEGGSIGMVVRVIGPFYRSEEIERFVQQMNSQNDGEPQKGMVWRKVTDALYIDDVRKNRYVVREMWPSETYLKKEVPATS